MRNNTLNIEYSGSVRNHKIKDGKKESMRVNNLIRAKQIISGIDKSIIKLATFKDKQGVETVVLP